MSIAADGPRPKNAAATYETGSRNRFHRRTQALPLAVYDAMQRSDYTLANQIAVVMVVIGYGSIWVTRRLEAEDGE